jgi:hypothetical protein
LAIVKPRLAIAPRAAPVRTAEVVLDGDYEGWRAVVRTNHRFGVLLDMESGDTERVVAALAKIVLEWNFVDEEGEPLPQPADGGIGQCDADALKRLMEQVGALFQAGGAVPKA